MAAPRPLEDELSSEMEAQQAAMAIPVKYGRKIGSAYSNSFSGATVSRYAMSVAPSETSNR
jgi:hypothetical protein